MKLYFFRQEALDYFKENIVHNIKYYGSKNNNWVCEQFNDPFLPLKLDVDDFELYINTDDVNKMDLENCKRIYSNLKGLTDSQATDERLWAGLSHSTFYDSVFERWNSVREEKNMKKSNYILSRYFFGQHSPKFRNTLAKLWWIGKLTYDEDDSNNPFHLTDVLGRYSMATRVNDLFTSNFCRNKRLIKAFLESVDECEDSKNPLEDSIFRSAVQFVNIYGGMYLVDFLSLEELKCIITKQIRYYIQNGPDVVKNSKNVKSNINDLIILRQVATGMRKRVIVNESNLKMLLERKVHDLIMMDNSDYEILGIWKKK